MTVTPRISLPSGSNPPTMTNTDGIEVPAGAIQFLDNVVFADAFGQLSTASMQMDVSVSFSYGLLNEEFDVKAPVITSDGVADATGGTGNVSSAATGTAILESRDSIRYSNGRGFFGLYTASFAGAGVGWAGPHDDNDGFPIRVTNGVLEFGYLKSGVFTGAITVDTTGLDLTKENIFAVLGGHLGVANPTLLVKKDTWKALAVIKTEGVLDSPHVRLPSFPMRIKAEDGMAIKSGSWSGGIFDKPGGRTITQDRGFSYPNQPFTALLADNPIDNARGKLTLSGTAVATAVVFRSKATFNGLPNKVKIEILDYSFTVAPTATSGTVEIQALKNPPLGAGTFADVSASSVMGVDDVGGAQAAGVYNEASPGGTLVGDPLVISYSGSGGNKAKLGGVATALVEQVGLDLIAGETLAFIARDADGNNVPLRWHVTWVERQL